MKSEIPKPRGAFAKSGAAALSSCLSDSLVVVEPSVFAWEIPFESDDDFGSGTVDLGFVHVKEVTLPLDLANGWRILLGPEGTWERGAVGTTTPGSGSVFVPFDSAAGAEGGADDVLLFVKRDRGAVGIGDAAVVTGAEAEGAVGAVFVARGAMGTGGVVEEETTGERVGNEDAGVCKIVVGGGA